MWKDGNKYDGYWVDGKPQGFGDFIYSNGDKYKGEDFLVEKKMESENTHGKMATHIMVIGLMML